LNDDKTLKNKEMILQGCRNDHLKIIGKKYKISVKSKDKQSILLKKVCENIFIEDIENFILFEFKNGKKYNFDKKERLNTINRLRTKFQKSKIVSGRSIDFLIAGFKNKNGHLNENIFFKKYNSFLKELEIKNYPYYKMYIGLCSEYIERIFIENNFNCIPTLFELSGIDIFEKSKNIYEGRDIKVIHNIPKKFPEQNINKIKKNRILATSLMKHLYEDQGSDRFKNNKRIFIYVQDINKAEKKFKKHNYIIHGLYEISYKYKGKEYNTEAKIIFV